MQYLLLLYHFLHLLELGEELINILNLHSAALCNSALTGRVYNIWIGSLVGFCGNSTISGVEVTNADIICNGTILMLMVHHWRNKYNGGYIG